MDWSMKGERDWMMDWELVDNESLLVIEMSLVLVIVSSDGDSLSFNDISFSFDSDSLFDVCSFSFNDTHISSTAGDSTTLPDAAAS